MGQELHVPSCGSGASDNLHPTMPYMAPTSGGRRYSYSRLTLHVNDASQKDASRQSAVRVQGAPFGILHLVSHNPLCFRSWIVQSAMVRTGVVHYKCYMRPMQRTFVFSVGLTFSAVENWSPINKEASWPS